MSDFVDRLERELLAAGRRSPARRVARWPFGPAVPWLLRPAVPWLLSVGVTGAIVAVIIVAALAGSTHPQGVSTTPVPPTVSNPRPKGFSAHACRFKVTSRGTVLPPLIKKTSAPSSSLLSQAGFLRRPATAADGFTLRSLDRWPWTVLAVYTRYIRIISGPSRTRVAVMPAVICSSLPSASGPQSTPSPREVLLMQVLGTPRISPAPTIVLGTAAGIRVGAANGYIDNPVPRGRSGLWVSVVPDGVVRAVFRFPGHRPATATMTIDENIGIANPVPQYAPASITWYAAGGRAIRTFRPPYALP